MLSTVRGTVQADILKEDQGQNTSYFFQRVCPENDGGYSAILYRSSMFKIFILFPYPDIILPRQVRTRSLNLRLPCQTGLPMWSIISPAGMNINSFAPNLSFFFSKRHGPGVYRNRTRCQKNMGCCS